jgi:hypothetical protein
MKTYIASAILALQARKRKPHNIDVTCIEVPFFKKHQSSVAAVAVQF